MAKLQKAKDLKTIAKWYLCHKSVIKTGTKTSVKS